MFIRALFSGSVLLGSLFASSASAGDVRTLKDIEVLASVNYGEDTMGKGVPLPKELSYLK